MTATHGRSSVTLEEIIYALRYGDARLEVVQLIFGGSGFAVQAKVGNNKKYGPMILPNEGETLGDVLKMLGDLVEQHRDEA